MSREQEDEQGVESPPSRLDSLRSYRSSDARARRSNAALRKALLTLLQDKSFDQISIRDICSLSGVHVATFYRHYSAKEDLLEDIAHEQIAELNRITLAIRGANDYQAGFVALCRYVDDRRELWATLLNGGAGGAMREEWLRQSKLVAASGEATMSWLPMDLGTICAATLIAETLAWWLSPIGSRYRVEQMADILLGLFTRPIIDIEPA